MSGGDDPNIIDTLALAFHVSGQTPKAILLQRKAISLLPQPDTRFNEKLEEYVASLTTGQEGQGSRLGPVTEQDTVASDAPADEKEKKRAKEP
jgi:hypothetical protein